MSSYFPQSNKKILKWSCEFAVDLIAAVKVYALY